MSTVLKDNSNFKLLTSNAYHPGAASTITSRESTRESRERELIFLASMANLHHDRHLFMFPRATKKENQNHQTVRSKKNNSIQPRVESGLMEIQKQQVKDVLFKAI